MNYNNWNGRRSSRGRGRNRNKWSWRGRSYNRMPMLDPMMHNAHPGYNQNYQVHHENRGFYNYKSFVSPSHRKITPPPKPPSPLPGTEEYTQRNIQHASDLIKRQLNIDSDTCSASDADINKTSEQSTDNAKDNKAVENDKSSNACAATVTSTRNTQEKKSASSQQSSKQKATSKPSECINVQKIYAQIVQHISNLSHSKKINLVNQSTDGYDIAIQQVQKQKRLELSRALRDMSKRQTQNSNDGEVINAIIPDIGIKIEDLPKEVIADLSRTLHIELEDRVEQVSNLVDPEVCFKQAEAILSVNFENTMDDQGFQGIASTFNYDYLNKPLPPTEFTDKFATPSTSNQPFSPPEPVPYPLPTGLNPDEVKSEKMESDDFTADIDFCIKNLDVHKSYLTCFPTPKQLEARNALFESTDGSFKLPQIKVRTDLITQSPVEAEAIVENRNILTDPLQNLQSPISSDVPQLPTCNIHPKVADSDLQLDSSSNTPSVAHSKLPDGLEHSTAKIGSSLTLDSQLEQNLKSDTKINCPSLAQISQDTVDKSDSIRPEFISLMNEGDGNTRHKEPKCSEKRSANVTQCIPENKEEEFAEINKISESELQPFTLLDEKVPSALPDFTSGGLNDQIKRNDYPETAANLNPESSFMSALSKTSLPERKPETAPSELVVETELAFPSTRVKVDDPLLETPVSNCSDNILTEGTSNNEDKKTDTSLSAIPESVLHTHAEGPQKRWKSPGEKKMIPNVPSSVSEPVVQDNSSGAEKSIDDILNESDDITKSILEQMEEFNRSLMGITTEKDKAVNVTMNKQGVDKELDFLDDKSILATGTATQVNEEVEETQNQNVTGSQPLEKSIESDAIQQKRAMSEPREDQEMTCIVGTTTEEQLKMEVKEENVSKAPELTKGDEIDVKNIEVKFPIENIELKKEPADLESSSSKSKDIKSEPVEKEVGAAKPKHKESSKERSRSNSKEKQHHRSGSKSKGHHQESHKSSKNKSKHTQDDGSSYRKIKTPAEKKETINLKIMSTANTQTDFTEQPKKGKREVARNSAAVSTQTDVLEQAQTKKGKVISTQTDLSEQQQPSKKAKAIEKKDSVNVVSTQTDFLEPPQNKKVKAYTLSTQTDLVEPPAQSMKVKSYTLSTQTDSVELIHTKKGKPKETKSVQTDFCDPKKGKPEKIKSKNSGTQSEAARTHSREIQATCSFKSIEIQTDPFKMSFSNDAVDINLNTEGIKGKMMLRKYAVGKLKDIGAQIEHLMKLQQSFYELMLESDDESETLNAQSSTQLDSVKVEPDLRIQLEDVKQVKPIAIKESEGKSAAKSRKRKADVSNENKRSKRLKYSDEAESTATEPSVDEVNTNACLENINTTNKKDRRKRRIEEKISVAETRGPLNIKISLKNLKASPYRNEEETVTKQKPRKGRDSKTKSMKIKEEKEGRSSSIDTVMNEIITEEVHIKEEIPEVSIKQEIPPDIHVEDPADQSEPEEQKQILKIKLPLKRFRSKKANSEAIDDVNLMMTKYSRELGKVPRCSDTRSKRKSDRRSKQTTSNNVPDDLDEVQRHGYDKRFFMCNVSLRRYNLQELNQLKETIHSELEVKSEQISSDTPDVNVDNLSVPNLNDMDITSESPVKSENVVEPPPTDKTIFDMSPISLQMLEELKQVVDSVPETSDSAVTSDTVTTEDQEIEFNTFNSALLILKVINSVMLAGSETGKLYYYNIENGDVLHAMHLSKKPLTCICVSKYEDKLNVYVGSLNGKISVVDFEIKHVANTIKLDEGVQCMELSWDYLFVGTHKGQLVRYDLKKEKVDDSIKIYDTSILAVKATQEGARRVLLLATRNELVSVRDAMTGLLMRTMENSFYPTVYTILLNNNFVYCGTSHHDILVYTFQDGQMAFTHEASNSKGVACLKIVGNLLFAGCYNGNVYVYNITTNDYLGQIVGPGMILSLEVLEDKIFLGTKNNKLKSLRIPKNFLDQL